MPRKSPRALRGQQHEAQQSAAARTAHTRPPGSQAVAVATLARLASRPKRRESVLHVAPAAAAGDYSPYPTAY